MNKNAVKTGIKASGVIIMLTVCFFVMVLVFPRENYKTVTGFIAAYRLSLLMPAIPAFLLTLVNIPFYVSLYFYSDEQKRPIALTGLLFGVGYSLCCGINYFMQLTIVPLNVQLKQEGLLSVSSMFISGSPAYMLDNLGYAFLSIGFLFFSMIFNLKGLQGYIKSAYVVYGISGLTGVVGYITAKPWLESFLIISALPYLIAVVLTFAEYIRLYKNTDIA